MDIIITGIIGLGAGLALGGVFWGHYSDTVAKQVDEIDALNLNNLRLRGQCSELANLAYGWQEAARERASEAEHHERQSDQRRERIQFHINEHAATKRKLAAAKGQITKLKKAMGEQV